VTLSSGERAAYEEYYAGQGLTAQQIEDAITTLENGRTQEYRDLHKTYGKLGESFDAVYRYGTAATQSFADTAVDTGTDSVTLKGNAFDTGDAVAWSMERPTTRSSTPAPREPSSSRARARTRLRRRRPSSISPAPLPAARTSSRRRI
jgi:hypothetical protein